jgi:hypothetical protein
MPEPGILLVTLMQGQESRPISKVFSKGFTGARTILTILDVSKHSWRNIMGHDARKP